MRRAPTTVGKVLSGRGCPAFSRRWCICRLERDGAGCSVLCIRIPIGDRENNCKQTLQSVQVTGSPPPFCVSLCETSQRDEQAAKVGETGAGVPSSRHRLARRG